MSKKDEELLGVWSELFVGHAFAVRAIEQHLAGRAPLSLAEYDVMLCISRSPGERIRCSALAAATVYTKSGITRILSRLEDEGFVSREECPEDKRGAFACVTDAGQKALADTWHRYSQAILAVLGPLYREREAVLLRELLGRIVEHVGQQNLVTIRGRAAKR